MEDGMGEKEKTVDILDIRYYLEHQLMPRWFLKDTEVFLAALLKPNANFLYTTIQKICEKEGVELPYKKEQYQLELFSISEEIEAICITLPEPEKSTLCKRVYLLFDRKQKKYKFFTIERGDIFESRCTLNFIEMNFLCGWDLQEENLVHLNYAVCLNGQEEEVNKIKELFST